MFTMAILLAILGSSAFGLSLWGSILGCLGGECCEPTHPAVFTVSLTASFFVNFGGAIMMSDFYRAA